MRHSQSPRVTTRPSDEHGLRVGCDHVDAFHFRDHETTRESAREAVQFCAEHNIAYIETAAQCLVYWSEEKLTDPNTGLTIEAIVNRWDKVSNGTGVTLFQFTLAETQYGLGNYDRAAEILSTRRFKSASNKNGGSG